MGLFKGRTVILHERPAGWLWTPFSFEDGEAVDGTTSDALNRAVYEERTVMVENVLIAPSSESEITETLNLYGRKAVYTLGLPKGDKHVWAGGTVEFFGRTWAVIGDVTMGIEDLVPTEWHKKVRVEAVNGKL